MPKKIEDSANISNLEVLKKLEDEKDFAKNIAKNNKKLGTNQFIPTEEEKVPLPSRGIPYREITNDKDIQNGYIIIREIKGHDENIIATQRYLKDGSALKRILNNCIISDIDAEDLTTFDFNFLLFFLRKLSYGDDYKFPQTCINSLCEKDFEVECKISELSFNEIPEDFEEPIKLTLPKSKFKIESILTRQYHIDEMRKLETKEKKFIDTTDKIFIRKLVLTTIKITSPDGKEIPQKSWEDFFNELSGFDLAFLREKTDFNTDIEGKEVTCPYCNRTQKAAIPMGADFFRLR